jgi:hypothetical protein
MRATAIAGFCAAEGLATFFFLLSAEEEILTDADEGVGSFGFSLLASSPFTSSFTGAYKHSVRDSSSSWCAATRKKSFQYRRRGLGFLGHWTLFASLGHVAAFADVFQARTTFIPLGPDETLAVIAIHR